MDQKWLICFTVLVFVENIDARKPPLHQEANHQATIRIPLLKSIGISRPKLLKNLEERRRGQEYIEQYQDMMKGSQESFENFDDRDDKRLRKLIGDDDMGLMAEAGGLVRRRARSGGRLSEQSVVGRRRAKSQAVRRDKLNVQSLSSHRRHSKPEAKYINN